MRSPGRTSRRTSTTCTTRRCRRDPLAHDRAREHDEAGKDRYLADMIEPNRKPYPGLRRSTLHDRFGQAMHMALLMSLDHVREQEAPHPDTMAALAEYEPGLV
ncbi:MAG: hypothetical protein ACLS6G_09430 [Christensenellales bacterium]